MFEERRSKETISTYNKAALNYQNKFMEMDLYHDTFDLFCSSIEKENPDLLEIACGPGNVTKYLLSKRPDFRIFGIDLAPKMVSLAQDNNPKADFAVMDCREIGKLDKSFDAIMCGFCMPYLSKDACATLIADSSKLLNDEGIIYISTMEDDYDKSGYETTSFSGQNRVYIYYHQAEYISDCLTKNGFEILELHRKDYPEPDGTFTTDMIFLARKIA